MKSSMIGANGIELHVVEEGEGPPVLFCHGFPDTWRCWRRQMDAVAAAGYRAITLDMRGFGRSSAPADASQYTQFHLVGDLVGLLDALQLPTVTVVGHDFGAYAAWNAGLMRPDRFTAIVGLSVPFQPRGETSALEDLRAAGRTELYVFFQMSEEADRAWADAESTIPGVLYRASATPPPAERWNPFDWRSLFRGEAATTLPPWADPDDVAYTIAEFQRTGFHTGLNYYRALQLGFDLSAPFKGMTIRQPCLFMIGQADGLRQLNARSPEQIRQDMPGLRGYMEVEGAGHWLMQEKPEVVNEAIIGFLLGLAGPSSTHQGLVDRSISEAPG